MGGRASLGVHPRPTAQWAPPSVSTALPVALGRASIGEALKSNGPLYRWGNRGWHRKGGAGLPKSPSQPKSELGQTLRGQELPAPGPPLFHHGIAGPLPLEGAGGKEPQWKAGFLKNLAQGHPWAKA